MLLLSILLFTAAMPFSTLLKSSVVIFRVAILVILLCSLLAFNSYFIEPLGVGVGIYGGLSLLSVISHGLTTLILASACLFMLVASGSLSNMHSRHIRELYPAYARLYYILLEAGQRADAVLVADELATAPDPDRVSKQERTVGAPIPELPLIILITTLGMTTLVTSSDLLTVYLSVELQTLPVYILACLNRESEAATSAGLKYFLIGALSSSFILLGSSLIYGLSGVTSLEGLYLLSSMGEGFTALVIPEVIIGIALLIKLGAAPFHFWPPDVYDGVPTLVTTWVAIMPKLGILGFLALFQGFSLIRGDLVTGYTYWGLILVASALLSLVIAPLLALAQYRIKRLVAYSSISHMGFMLLALALQSPQALEAFLFYLIQYVVTSFNLFFVLIAFPFQLSSSSLREIPPAPALRLSFAVTLFSMAGIPPFIGFGAKLLVVMAALDSGFLFLALLAILVSVITAGLYLRVIRVLLFVEGNPLGRSRGDTEAFPGASLNLPPSFPFPSSARVREGYCAYDTNPLISMLIATLTLIIILFLANPYASLNSLHLIALCYYYW